MRRGRGIQVESRQSALNHRAVQRLASPILKDLVLVGAGHAHVAVLKRFGMDPLPGLRVTLLSKDTATGYSGMIPGCIAGHYTHDEAHIELRALCRFAGATFIRAAVTGLDLERRRVLCAGRPPLGFDLLSINTGSTPGVRSVPGAAEHALRIKPLEDFLHGWETLAKEVKRQPGLRLRIVVVGGGAGGVELTLATQHRLREFAGLSAGTAGGLEFHLVQDGPEILPTHNARVRTRFLRVLRERSVRMHMNHRVTRVTPGLLICEPGEPVPFDRLFWAAQAEAPAWIAGSGLKTDAAGFVAVNDCLQSLSHPFVFAAGDVAAVENHPRPKSGVFAVRQGAPLAENLRRALHGAPLRPFRPQRHFLSLISTGDRRAVASRGGWTLDGAWVWRVKDWIDRRWMRQYQQLPAMEFAASSDTTPALADAAVLRELTAMRCGGCGAKVAASVLARVLERLRPAARADILVGLEAPDDAAVFTTPPGMACVQTVDFFRELTRDAYLFGRIAASHCLGDVFAMGARPQSALALAMLPVAAEANMEEQLHQLMAGALETLAEHDTALVGGHTAEGAELAFGLVVNGLADPQRLLRKGGLQPGDRLLLVKPLGTGALFAADMRGLARGTWIETATASMLRSNRAASECFLRHHATACTDVTGFGLLGHLVEILRASPGVGADLTLAAVPALDGALDMMRAGVFSSLHPHNLRRRHDVENLESAAAAGERFQMLFDPQTAGGLLAGVPASRAESCLEELRGLGYAKAAIIGAAVARTGGTGMVKVML
jgi:selenide,water dikinase